MNELPQTEDWLDARLREEAPYIDDAGFTAQQGYRRFTGDISAPAESLPVLATGAVLELLPPRPAGRRGGRRLGAPPQPLTPG